MISNYRQSCIRLNVFVGFIIGFTAMPFPSLAQESDESGALDAAYVDRSFGFSLRPPAGCTVFREKTFMDTADVELVRFADARKNWYLTVRLSETTRPLDARTMVDGITAKLSEFENVKVLRDEATSIGGREGVRYAASFTSKGLHVIRQQAIIRIKPTEYMALVFVSPSTDAPGVEQLFDRIVASFEIVRTEQRQEQLQEALERGRSLLQRLQSDGLRAEKICIEEQYLRFLQDDREIGFVEIRERAHTLDRKPGIEILKNIWLFMPEGDTTYLQHTMFVASDLTHERWENRLGVLKPVDPRNPDLPQQAFFDFESGFRQDDKLLIKYMPEPNAREAGDKAIEVDTSYAPAPWDLLFPRVVDLKKENLYAFSCYDTGRRGVQLRAFRVAGAKRVTIGGSSVMVTRIEDSEGLIPPINTIDVDDTGRILRVVAPGTVMEATTRSLVDVKYAKRVKESLAVLDRLAKEYAKSQR